MKLKALIPYLDKDGYCIVSVLAPKDGDKDAYEVVEQHQVHLRCPLPENILKYDIENDGISAKHNGDVLCIFVRAPKAKKVKK